MNEKIVDAPEDFSDTSDEDLDGVDNNFLSSRYSVRLYGWMGRVMLL